MKLNKGGFTLLEILIVIGLTTIVASFSVLNFNSAQQKSRDTRRKEDIEMIRSAIEFYKNVRSSYPSSASFVVNCSVTGTLSEGSTTFLEKTPKDPLCNGRTYYYSYSSGDYLLGARLEKGGPSTCGDCGGGNACNYCYNSYGILENAVTPTTGPTSPPSTPTVPPPNTPTPTPPYPLACSPELGTTTVGSNITFSAPGSLENQNQWSVSPGTNCTPSIGSGANFRLNCSTTGSRTITVTNNSVSDNCTMIVQ